MKKYGKKLLLIAVPIMLSDIISQLQLLIDKMFLGRLDITYMSAVGNASSPMWTTMNIIFGLTVGATILASQAYGAGDKEDAKGIIAALFKYNNVLSGILFLFWLFLPQVAFRAMGVDESIINMSITYAKIFSPIFMLLGIGASVMSMLQVSQKTGIMVVYGIVRSALNVLLDWMLIFGNLGMPAMGVGGAALATTIAELVGDIVVLVYIIRCKELWLKPSWKQILSARFMPYLNSVKLGTPNAIESFAWNFGNLYLIAMLNKVSIEAAGIHSIIFGIECLPIVVVGAIGTATLTVSGFETGNENKQGVWDVIHTALFMVEIFVAANLALFILFPDIILGIFTTDASIITKAPVYLMIIGIDLFPKAANINIGSGIKGYGDTVWMLMTQLFGTLFVIVGSSLLILVFHQGMIQLFILVVADEAIRCVMNYIKLITIRNKDSKSSFVQPVS